MSRQKVELRSWAMISISFVLGMMAAEFIDYQWRMHDDAPASVVSSDAALVETQP